MRKQPAAVSLDVVKGGAAFKDQHCAACIPLNTSRRSYLCDGGAMYVLSVVFKLHYKLMSVILHLLIEALRCIQQSIDGIIQRFLKSSIFYLPGEPGDEQTFLLG